MSFFLSLLESKLQSISVLTTNPYGTLTWNIILTLFIIGGIIAGIILFYFSKKPIEWKHTPKIEGQYFSGKLHNLADSIKFTSVDYSENAYLITIVQKIFLSLNPMPTV